MRVAIATSSLAALTAANVLTQGSRRRASRRVEPIKGRLQTHWNQTQQAVLADAPNGEDSILCDPNEEPDVGILSCGEGHFCSANDASELGGFCMRLPEVQSGRALQGGLDELLQYCNSTEINCDCSNLDLTTITGSINCTYAPGCTTYQGQQACLDATLDLLLNPFAGEVSAAYCVTISGLSLPYSTVCYSLTYDIIAGGSACNLSVDGVDCLDTICEIASCPADNNTGIVPENVSLTGYDCSNTAAGVVIEQCGPDTGFPVLKQLQEAISPSTPSPAAIIGDTTPTASPTEPAPAPSATGTPPIPPTAMPVAVTPTTMPVPAATEPDIVPTANPTVSPAAPSATVPSDGGTAPTSRAQQMVAMMPALVIVATAAFWLSM